jgi:ribonuclease III
MLFIKRNKGPYAPLEKTIGYVFRNKRLLEHALTHRSFRFENAGVQEDNQRLEFLGDAVLGLLTAAHVYAHFREHDEGCLTSFRSQVTSGKALAQCARELRIGEFLRIGKGEERTGGRHRATVQADALEAVIGAAYIDGGVRAVEKVFNKVFAPQIAALSGDVWDTNPKGRLQEQSQRLWKTSPQYRTVRQEGPAHAAVFTAEVLVGGHVRGTGQGSSKQEAEKQAAQMALKDASEELQLP